MAWGGEWGGGRIDGSWLSNDGTDGGGLLRRPLTVRGYGGLGDLCRLAWRPSCGVGGGAVGIHPKIRKISHLDEAHDDECPTHPTGNHKWGECSHNPAN